MTATFWRSRSKHVAFLGFVLLLPLAYSYSFLGGAPAHDFRFLYPSMVMVQAVSAAWLGGGILRLCRQGGVSAPRISST